MLVIKVADRIQRNQRSCLSPILNNGTAQGRKGVRGVCGRHVPDNYPVHSSGFVAGPSAERAEADYGCLHSVDPEKPQTGKSCHDVKYLVAIFLIGNYRNLPRSHSVPPMTTSRKWTPSQKLLPRRIPEKRTSKSGMRTKRTRRSSRTRAGKNSRGHCLPDGLTTHQWSLCLSLFSQHFRFFLRSYLSSINP